jgi:carbon-monoxide dehydrogenase large subunit
VEERSESSVATTHGRGQIQDISLAARRDGTLLGIRVSILSSMGAYLQLETAGIPALGRLMFPGQYGANAYSFEATSVFTNEPPTGAYRGVGRAEATYGLERMMDHLAREVGLDPAEIRRRNYLPKGESVVNSAGIPYDSVDYEPPLDRVLELAGYGELRAKQSEQRDRGGRLLGVGISSYVDATGLGSSPLLSLTNYQWGGWESGRVRVLPTGKVEVFSGTVPQGQGHETAWAQLTAESLGVPMEDVAVFQGDTAIVPHGTGTFGSRSLCVGGAAIHMAAQSVIRKARTIAAHLLETAEEDLEFIEGRFTVSGAPERGVSLPDVARAAYLAHSLPAGTDPGLDENAVFEPPDWTYPFGIHLAVVEVDTETGQVRVLRYVAVDDCGNVLNPMLVEGQVRGGIAQGVGQALFEEVTYTADGQPEATSLLSYLVPSPADLPSFELDRTVTPTTINPLGAKGVAEAGTIAAPAAIMNAVVDALVPLGVLDMDMPASPQRVWAAIRAAKEPG